MKKIFYIGSFLFTMLLYSSCTTTKDHEHFVSDKEVDTTKTKPGGGLTSNEIMTVMRSKENLPVLRKCYENVLIFDPYFSSKLIVKFKIAANGRSKEIKIIKATMRHSVLEKCIVETTRSLVFPKPRGGQDVTVNYPYFFNPL